MNKNELVSFGAMSKEERENFIKQFNGATDETVIKHFFLKIKKTCFTIDELLLEKAPFFLTTTKGYFWLNGTRSKNNFADINLSLNTAKLIIKNNEGPISMLEQTSARACHLTSNDFSSTKIKFKIIVLGDDAKLYASNVEIFKPYDWRTNSAVSIGLTLSKFKQWSRFTTSCFVLIKDIEGFMQAYNPYLTAWAKTNNVRLDWALQCPQLEQVSKMGYTNFLVDLNNDSIEASKIISRLTTKKDKVGKAKKMWNVSNGSTNLLAKTVLSLINDNMPISLKEWDLLRKLMHTEKISSEDEIRLVYELGLSDEEQSLFNSVLTRKYNGKRVFTATTLAEYLKKIDMYEAINKKDGLILIRDYLICCETCKSKPRIDSDSLKREHDIMARNARYTRDPKMDEKIHYATQYLRKYEYEERQFFIRPLVSFADMLDEANQQRNSIAAYGNEVVNKRMRLFTMRSTHTPSKCFVTVELSPDNKHIRQYLLAANRKVRNKAVTDFLQRWLKRVQAIDRGEEVEETLPVFYSKQWDTTAKAVLT